MNERLICPYCEEWVDFDTEYCYDEGKLYEAECGSCGKKFGVRVSISFNYYEEKVDCWNGAPHDYHNHISAPREYAIGKQYCYNCGHEREINKEEWKKIEADYDHPQNWRNR